MIFDTHAHYDDQAFDEDREELLSGLFENGVGYVLDASAAVRNMPFILELTKRYDFLYGSAGIHPCEAYQSGDNAGKPVMKKRTAGEWGFGPLVLKALDLYEEGEIITPDWRAGDREEQLIRAMLAEPKIMAVGEIGLDYHYEDTQKDVQKDWFARQICIAREFHKPIFVHSRDVAAETLDLIRAEKAQEVGGIIHCFSYSKEMAREYVDLGFLIGIGGVLTYKNAKKLKEVAAYVPMDHIVLETDCPYLAPSPFRGKRNDSSLIRYTAEVLAQIKGLSAEEVIQITEENACRVYNIPR